MGAKNMHVTIVDDVEENLSSYRDLLEDEFELKLIQDPVNLLGFLNIGKTDLVVLDFHMPNMNGFELYKKMRKTHPNTPVIFLTGDP